MLRISSICRNIVKTDFIFFKHVSNRPEVILIPHLDEDVHKGVERGEMGPKKHPGILKRELTVLEDEIINTIKKILKDSRYPILLKDARNYQNYIRGRQPPISQREIQAEAGECYQQVLYKKNVDLSTLDEDQRDKVEKQVRYQAVGLLKSHVYAWAPIEYTEYVGKQYLVQRMAPEYAVLNKIFLEISQRCPDFKPDSLFDFGSGVGTVTWVARKYWEQYLKEYYNVDISPDMNNIARQMLAKGDPDPEAELPIKNVFYRQFLPATATRKYSIVVSSYSLLELPSRELRLQTVMKLWNKTEDFLVIVEQGNKVGFRLVLEARDFILDTRNYSKKLSNGHVFAPCPHDLDCPLTALTEKPCCFKASYERVAIGRSREIVNEYFSYVILRKGTRPDDDQQWPRLVYPVRKKKKRAICHLCVKNGKFCRYMFKKSTHGKTYYHFGRSLQPGERLPMSFTECDITDSDNVVEVQDNVEDELLNYDQDDDDQDS